MFWSDYRDAATVIGTPAIIADNGDLQVGIFTGEKPSTTVTTPDGEEYFARTISFDDTQGNSFEDGTYVLIEHVDYKGESKGQYVSDDG